METIEEIALRKAMRWVTIVSILLGMAANSVLIVLSIWAVFVLLLYLGEYAFARLERIRKGL